MSWNTTWPRSTARLSKTGDLLKVAHIACDECGSIGQDNGGNQEVRPPDFPLRAQPAKLRHRRSIQRNN
jgi:hypothetical protein